MVQSLYKLKSNGYTAQAHKSLPNFSKNCGFLYYAFGVCGQRHQAFFPKNEILCRGRVFCNRKASSIFCFLSIKVFLHAQNFQSLFSSNWKLFYSLFTNINYTQSAIVCSCIMFPSLSYPKKESR